MVATYAYRKLNAERAVWRGALNPLEGAYKHWDGPKSHPRDPGRQPVMLRFSDDRQRQKEWEGSAVHHNRKGPASWPRLEPWRLEAGSRTHSPVPPAHATCKCHLPAPHIACHPPAPPASAACQHRPQAPPASTARQHRPPASHASFTHQHRPPAPPTNSENYHLGGISRQQFQSSFSS